jgi:hypothetical protein
MEDRADMMYVNDPVFRIDDDAQTSGQGQPQLIHAVATFEGETTLRSGWAWGQRYLDRGIGVATVGVGKGQLILYGPEVLFRAQPHGTFKLFFNGLLWPGEKTN